MEGSTSSRVARVVARLLQRPQDLPSYLQYLPLWQRTPADVELPWISFGALRFLEKSLRPHHTVFEFGSGGSSFFFARRAAQVFSVESDPAWHARVTQLAQARGIKNLRCELHPIRLDQPDSYPEQSYFTALQPQGYDVILVDAYLDFENARYGRTRQIAFARALECVRKPGGMIVVDDFWMLRELTAQAPQARLREFVSTGPCRYGVTSTAVFMF